MHALPIFKRRLKSYLFKYLYFIPAILPHLVTACASDSAMRSLCARYKFSYYYYYPVLYQVLNKQVPVPVPVPVVQVPVQVLFINYRHSVTLQLHKVKVVVSFVFKKN